MIVDTAISQALLQCQSFTARTGNEYGITLDKKGNRVFESQGDSHGIVMEDCHVALLDSLGNTGIFVHSHPTNSCLSIQDLQCGYRFNLEIYAITPRGDVFEAKRVEQYYSLYNAYWNEWEVYNTMKENLAYFASIPLHLQKALNHLQVHILWEECKEKHYMQYDSVLTAQTQKELDDIKTILTPYRCRY